MSKKTFAFIILLVILAIGGAYYWFFIRNASPGVVTPISGNDSSVIFNGTGGGNTSQGGTKNNSATGTSTATTSAVPIPVLRELSTTPVGGMQASTTGSSTIIRWIDRGAGRVYQAYNDNTAIDELSNTTIPRVYATYWNSAATSFILQSLDDTTSNITTFYAHLYPSSASSTNATPFELHGAQLPTITTALAVAPTGDRVFTLENDALKDDSIGYISQFDGSKKTQILSTPLTMVNVEWPASNTIAITTKGYSKAAGFLYFADPKTGLLTKILGNVAGLSTLTSKDGSEVLYSASVSNSIKSSVYNVKNISSQDLVFNTMPEKCVWSNLQKNILYCAVPVAIPTASYPEAWYQGVVSFNDSIWEVNAVTGDAHLVADLSKAGASSIDAVNLTLDPQENYLYFINKDNLTLWSLELNG